MAGKCSLCGGQLNRDQRCSFCGLDNKQNDSRYKAGRNRSVCDEGPMTHIHKEEPRRENPNGQAKGQVRTAIHQKPGGTQKSGNKLAIIVFALFIGLMVGRIIITSLYAIRQGSLDFSEEEFFWGDSDYIESEYTILREVASLDGEVYETTLTAGMYRVGVDIPEGMYKIEMTEGMYIALHEANNGIVQFIESQDAEDMGEIPLCEGMYVNVPLYCEVSLDTWNAQLEQMQEKMENPMMESLVVKDDVVVGEALAAGVYDVWIQPAESEAFGSVEVILPLDCDPLYLECNEYDGAGFYKNLVLPEGTILILNNVEEVSFVSSEKILDEDYEGYYYNYIQ